MERQFGLKGCSLIRLKFKKNRLARDFKQKLSAKFKRKRLTSTSYAFVATLRPSLKIGT